MSYPKRRFVASLCDMQSTDIGGRYLLRELPLTDPNHANLSVRYQALFIHFHQTELTEENPKRALFEQHRVHDTLAIATKLSHPSIRSANFEDRISMYFFQTPSAPSSDVKARASRLIATTALATGIFALPFSASAFEAEAFFKALQETAKERGDTLTFGEVKAEGDDSVTLQAVELVDGDSGNRMTIERMQLTGVEEAGSEAINFATMSASAIALDVTGKQGGESRITVNSASAEEFRFVGRTEGETVFPFAMGAGRLDTVRIKTTGKDGKNASASFTIPFVEASGVEPSGDMGFMLSSLSTGTGTGSYTSDDGGSGSFELGEMRLEGFERKAGSGVFIDAFSVGSASVDGTSAEGQAVVMTAEGFSASSLYYPDFTGSGSIQFPETPGKGQLGRIDVTLDGTEVFSLGGANFLSTYDGAEKVNEGSFALNDLSINVKDLPVKPGGGDGKQQLLALGYETLTLGARLDGAWDIDDGVLEISRYRISMDDGGAIALSTRILGYTEAFARKLAQLSQLMGESSDTETQQALSMQMLAEASALMVDQLSLRVSDDSLSRKILVMQAAKSGQTAEDMAAALPFMAGAMMAQFDVPEFAASVSSALGTFLANPGNLVLTADPQEPVSVAEVMGIAGGVKAGNVTPAQVIERLNITMNANCSEEGGAQEPVQC